MTTHNLNNNNLNDQLPTSDLVQAVKNLYKRATINKIYKVKINKDEYQVYKTDHDQALLCLPATQIIPLKTAAVSILAIELLHKYSPEHIAIYGTGKQAQAHIKALLALYPNIIIDVIAKTPSKSLEFVQSYADRRVRCTRIVFPEVDTVITATNSQRPVYSLQAETQRLVIGIGAQSVDHMEIGRNTIQKSTIYTDDINSARLRAGDLLKAEINWSNAHSLFNLNPDKSLEGPVLFKNMGAEIWDQAVISCLVNKQLLD